MKNKLTITHDMKIFRAGAVVYTIKHNKIVDILIDRTNITLKPLGKTSVCYQDYEGNLYDEVSIFETKEEADKYIDKSEEQENKFAYENWIQEVHGD